MKKSPEGLFFMWLRSFSSTFMQFHVHAVSCCLRLHAGNVEFGGLFVLAERRESESAHRRHLMDWEHRIESLVPSLRAFLGRWI